MATDAEVEEGGEVDLQSDEQKRLALRQRRREQVEYLKQHRAKLEKVAQRCVNRVLLQLPPDPYEALLFQLSAHVKASGISFDRLRVSRHHDEVVLEVSADARSAKLLAHHVVLPLELARSLVEDQEGVEVKAPESLAELFLGVNVLDFQEIHERLSLIESEPLRARLAGELLEAAGRLMDCTSSEAMRAGISEFGRVLEEEEEECLAPALQCQKDLETWQWRWPSLCFPVRATGGRRLAIGLEVWAAALPDAAQLLEPLEVVDAAAEEARLQALQELNLEEIDQDELPEPEPHEYCPPLNAVELISRLGSVLAEKAGGGSLNDLGAGLKELRQAINALLPRYVANEQKLSELQSEEHAAQKKAAAAARFKAAQEDSDDESTSVESEKEPIVLLQEIQQQSSVYLVLHADADAAFEDGSYSFHEAMTQAQLLEHYATLCKEEPLLRCIIAPLAQKDPELQEGLKALRQRLPAHVSIVDDICRAEPKPLEEESCDEGEGEPANARAGIGRLLDLRLTALGLATQRIRFLKAENGHHQLATAELGRDSVMDFEAQQEMLPVLGSLMDFALSTRDRCRLLLPLDQKEALEPLAERLRCMARTAYRTKKSASSVQKKSKDLNKQQFVEGLRRLGYGYAEDYAGLIFDFLDQSGNGSISPSELQLLELVDGAGSLEDLDRLRIWLCDWKARRAKAAEGSLGEGETEEVLTARAIEAEKEKKRSPLAELWQYMDRDGSGEASFSEFRRALRKARHPAGLNPNKGPALELFMCLDIQVDGSIVEGEFYCFSILSAYFQLQRVERVRSFLESRFGTLKAAFKYMDADRSGSLTTQEWMDFMMGPQGYADEEDVKVCFFFIDKDFSGQLTSKEFEFLGAFNSNDFVDNVKHLRDYLVEKYENLEDAYDAFEQKVPPLDLGGPELRDIPQKRRQRRSGRGLSGQDFVNACRLCGFKGRFDPRLLFNFLDASHVGHLTANEFLQLGKLGAVEALRSSSERMKKGIGSLKAFIFEEVQLEEPEEVVDEKWKWAAIHQALRDVTQDDLELVDGP